MDLLDYVLKKTERPFQVGKKWHGKEMCGRTL